MKDGLIEALLAASDDESLAKLIDTHGLSIKTIEALKTHSATCYFDRPGEALRVAEVAARLGRLLRDGVHLQDGVHLPTPAQALGDWTLANALLFADRYEEAVELYDDARAAYLALDQPLEAARMGVGHVWALAYTGQLERALELTHEIQPVLALAAERNRADRRRLGGLFNNLGITYDLLGQYEEALSAYDRKLDIAQALDNEVDIGRTHHNRACALTYLNAFDSALSAFRKAEAVFQEADLTADLARLAYNCGTLYAQWGQFAEAEKQFAEAQEQLGRLEETDQARAALTVYRALAQLESGKALSDQLLDALIKARTTLAEHGPPFEEGLAWLALGRHYLAVDDRSSAQVAFERMLTIADSGGGAPLTWEALHLLGNLAERRDDPVTALRHYRRAIEKIETISGDLYVEAFRAGFVADKLDVFADLAMLHARLGDLQKAFAVVDGAKSRLLAERLADRLDDEIASLQKIEDPKSQETAERLSDVLQRLERFRRQARLDETQERGTLWSVAPNPETAAAVRQLEEEAVKLSRELERRQPPSSPLSMNLALLGQGVHPHPVRELTSRLRKEGGAPRGDRILLQFHVARGQVWVFVMSRAGIVAHLKLASLPEVETAQRRVSAAVERALGLALSYGSDILTRYLSSLLVDAHAQLVDLYDLVVRPLEPHLPPEAGLVILPDGPLHHVPFHALRDGDTYLIERHIISYAPSVTVLDLCARHRAYGQDVLVMGYAGHHLTRIQAEVKAVADLFPEAELLSEAGATASRLLEKAPRCRILHLAAHARFRNDRAMLSSFSLADRRLSLTEIARLQLGADLVTLSACETGRGRRYGADLISLAGGFLGAGARALLVSLWRVDDESTARLMSGFYRALQSGKGRAAALRTAQLKLLALARERPEAYGRYRHPAYWAPFMLIGEWGRLSSSSQGRELLVSREDE
jgi:tetratricopeptide (TPR) repeat protein